MVDRMSSPAQAGNPFPPPGSPDPDSDSDGNRGGVIVEERPTDDPDGPTTKN